MNIKWNKQRGNEQVDKESEKLKYIYCAQKKSKKVDSIVTC